MYHIHFGLREEPFGVTPDQRFFYPTAQHSEAVATLFCAVQQRRGFALLFGRAGLGKTSVLFSLVQMLKGEAQVAYLPNPYYDRDTVFEAILDALGLEIVTSPAATHKAFCQYLLKVHTAGKTAVVVFDEAQDLNPGTLEAIRMLSNFETPDEKLLQIVLAGQPRLAETLQRPDCEQIRQRFSAIARLEPLARPEVHQYIDHRLEAVGGSIALFTPDAIDMIASASGGVPRNINTICFNSLTLAYALEKHQVGTEQVAEALRDLELPVSVAEPEPAKLAVQERQRENLTVSHAADDQRLLDDPRQTPVPDKSAAANLPVRSSELEGPPTVVRNGGASPVLLKWYMLWRRKGGLALSACMGLLVAMLFTLPQTPVYQARNTLEIQDPMRDLHTTVNRGAAQGSGIDFQTQIGILQSESVLKQVIADRDLSAKLVSENQKSRLSGWRKALHLSDSKPAPTADALLPLLAANLKVRSVANTRLVEILYDSTDPRLAADVANATSAAFIRQNFESHRNAGQQTGDWLTSQVEDARIKLGKSEEELQAYATTAGPVFTSEKDKVDEEKLRQLGQELSKARADLGTKKAQYELATTASPGFFLPHNSRTDPMSQYEVATTPFNGRAFSPWPLPVAQRIQNEFESAQRREKLLAASYQAQARVMAEQAAKVTHYDILKREVDNNRQLYDSTLQRVREAAIASTLKAGNARMVDPARLPTRPYKPRFVLNCVLGLFAGVFVGLIFIVLGDREERNIQAPGESSMYLAVPELGVIPSAAAARRQSFAYYRMAKGTKSKTPEKENGNGPVELVTWNKQPSALADCFRSTLASILYAGDNGNRPRVIALSSANPGEGKTTVACNLALALAEIGRRVLLIDGDLRKPRLHEIFNLSNTLGLSDLLGETNRQSEAAVVGTDYGSLYVLPAGSAGSRISNLLHSPRALELVERLRQEFDMVIVDTPPMLQMPDARVLGRLADGVILVVRSARTTKEAAVAATQRLVGDGTRVLGTVLNEWDPQKTSRAHYKYGYGYQPPYYQPSRPSAA